MKLALAEPESKALRIYLAASGEQTSSEIVLAESVRAVRRNAEARGLDLLGPLSLLEGVVKGLDLRALDRQLLAAAGELRPLALGTLDAIHLATALAFPQPGLSFVSYHQRQLVAARQAGLATASPGWDAA